MIAEPLSSNVYRSTLENLRQGLEQLKTIDLQCLPCVKTFMNSM